LDNEVSAPDDYLLFKIGYTGDVALTLSGEYTMFCSMDATYYPYDVQSCYISKFWL